MAWPEWWEWELELTPHAVKRMEDRDFTEVELREMLEKARRYRPNAVEGRFVVETVHRRRPWQAIDEPDLDDRLLVVITAYPMEVAQ